MQALFRRLGRVLVGLLAGVYGGSELLGGLIAVAVPGAVAVHLNRRGTAVAEPGSRCRIPSPASAPSSSGLPLGEDQTAYDRYLVRARAVEPA